jgi:selenide, water dikinase
MLRPERAQPIERRVILVGAGNAHLLFVRRWGTQSEPGVAVTLVNDTPTVPYSAMVPGFIASEYRRNEVTIDLVRFCPANGVRLVPEPVLRIDSKERRLHFANRPSLGYDILSLGLGSIPQPPPGAGGIPWSSTLRPLGVLLQQLDTLEEFLRHSVKAFHFAVVGGGASGCELAFAVRKRFAKHAGFVLTLLHSGRRLLHDFPARTARKIEEQLLTQGISVRLNARVIGAGNSTLQFDGGESIACDGVLWATDPAPPPLLRESGLDLDAKGFLIVRNTLQAVNDTTVFGTGDCVTFPAYPDLPRNGVMAVGQGRRLFDNIVALLKKQPPRAFQPPKLWLSLLNMGNGSAVASYGPLSASGRWLRQWKDRIDKRWMEMFALQSDSGRDNGRSNCDLR